MEPHTPDRVALVFGLLFTTIGVVSVAGLTDLAEVDAGVAVGAALVVAAALVGFITVAAMRDAQSSAPSAVPSSDPVHPDGSSVTG